MQRAAGQHAIAPGHAASLIAAAQEPIAAAPKQQTGNEHLDGKLKIIGTVSLFLNPLMCVCTSWAAPYLCTLSSPLCAGNTRDMQLCIADICSVLLSRQK